MNDRLSGVGLFGRAQRGLHDGQNSTWRISPDPFWIDQKTYDDLAALGNSLVEFYQACQRLYQASVSGRQPDWVRRYLEAGKPDFVLEFGRMRRFRTDIPRIIRPDIIMTPNGYAVTELDSVPGGFGLLGALSEIYSDLGFELIGGRHGMVKGFAEAMLPLVSDTPNPLMAVVVSEESSDYWDEMVWMGQALTRLGVDTAVIRPEELSFCDESLYITMEGNRRRVDLIYRFFELFDLRNIPMIDLILYAVRKGKVAITPPLKSHLEEKLSFALLHHPALQGFWRRWLSAGTQELLAKVFPMTWVVDPAPLPPHAVIPGLVSEGRALTDWRGLGRASKRERELVLKPSGFSELAWGSRGVVVGHDVSSDIWSETIETALESFDTTPYVLQEFRKGTRVEASYLDFADGVVKSMVGRVRLCPYYYVTENGAEMKGILATICSLDKKVIHGMTDAIMVPTAVRP